jgi:hypothetical protein
MGSIKRYSTYSSELSNKLFPKQGDFFSDEARTYFNEAWLAYGKDLIDVQDFSEFLSGFTPVAVKDQINDPVWAESARRRWDSCRAFIMQTLDSKLKDI